MTDRELLELLVEGQKELNGKVGNLESRFDSLECKFDNLERRFDSLEGKVDNLESRFDNLEGEVSQLNMRMDRVEKDVKDIKLTIENEIRRDISIIAENHLSLNSKLDDALRIGEENKKDMFDLKLRVSIIEIQNHRRMYER